MIRCVTFETQLKLIEANTEFLEVTSYQIGPFIISLWEDLVSEAIILVLLSLIYKCCYSPLVMFWMEQDKCYTFQRLSDIKINNV